MSEKFVLVSELTVDEQCTVSGGSCIGGEPSVLPGGCVDPTIQQIIDMISGAGFLRP